MVYHLNQSTQEFENVLGCIFDIFEVAETHRNLQKLDEIADSVDSLLQPILNDEDGHHINEHQKECLLKLTHNVALPPISAPARAHQIQACAMLLVAIKSLITESIDETLSEDQKLPAVRSACKDLVKVIFNYQHINSVDFVPDGPVATRMVELLVGLYMMGPAWIAVQWIMVKKLRPASDPYPELGKTLAQVFHQDKDEYASDVCEFEVAIVHGRPVKFDLERIVKQACPSHLSEVKQSIIQSAKDCYNVIVSQFRTPFDIQDLIPDLQAMSRIVQSQLNVLFATMRMGYCWKMLSIQKRILTLVDAAAANSAPAVAAKLKLDQAQDTLNTRIQELENATQKLEQEISRVTTITGEIATLKSNLRADLLKELADFSGPLDESTQNKFIDSVYQEGSTTNAPAIRLVANTGDVGSGADIYAAKQGKVGSKMLAVEQARDELTQAKSSSVDVVKGRYEELKGAANTALNEKNQADPNTGDGERGTKTTCLSDAGYTSAQADQLISGEQSSLREKNAASAAVGDKKSAMAKTEGDAAQLNVALANSQTTYKNSGKSDDLNTMLDTLKSDWETVERDVRLVENVVDKLDADVFKSVIDRVANDPKVELLSFDGLEKASQRMSAINQNITAENTSYTNTLSGLQNDLSGEKADIEAEKVKALAVEAIWAVQGMDEVDQTAGFSSLGQEVKDMFTEPFEVSSQDHVTNLPATHPPKGREYFAQAVQTAKDTKAQKIAAQNIDHADRRGQLTDQLSAITTANNTAKTESAETKTQMITKLGDFCDQGTPLTSEMESKIPDNVKQEYLDFPKQKDGQNLSKSYYDNKLSEAETKRDNDQQTCDATVAGKTALKKKARDDKQTEIDDLKDQYDADIVDLDNGASEDKNELDCLRMKMNFVQRKVCTSYGSLNKWRNSSEKTDADSAITKNGTVSQITEADIAKMVSGETIQDFAKSVDDLEAEKQNLESEKSTLNSQLTQLQTKQGDRFVIGSILYIAHAEKVAKRAEHEETHQNKVKSLSEGGSIAVARQQCEGVATGKINTATQAISDAVTAKAQAVVARNQLWTGTHAEKVAELKADEVAAKARIVEIDEEIAEIQAAKELQAKEISDMSENMNLLDAALEAFQTAYINDPNEDHTQLNEAYDMALRVVKVDEAGRELLQDMIENETTLVAEKQYEKHDQQQIITDAQAYFENNGDSIEHPKNTEHETTEMKQADADKAQAESDKSDAEAELGACATTEQQQKNDALNAKEAADEQSDSEIHQKAEEDQSKNAQDIAAKTNEIREKDGEITDVQQQITSQRTECDNLTSLDETNAINTYITAEKAKVDEKLTQDKTARTTTYTEEKNTMEAQLITLQINYDEWIKKDGGADSKKTQCYADVEVPVTEARIARDKWVSDCSGLTQNILQALDDAIQSINTLFDTEKNKLNADILKFDNVTVPMEQDQLNAAQDNLISVAEAILASWNNHVFDTKSTKIPNHYEAKTQKADVDNAKLVAAAETSHRSKMHELNAQKTQQEFDNQAFNAHVASVAVKFEAAVESAIAAVKQLDDNALAALEETLREKTSAHASKSDLLDAMYNKINECLVNRYNNAVIAILQFMINRSQTEFSQKDPSYWRELSNLFEGTEFRVGSGAEHMFKNLIPQAEQNLEVAQQNLSDTQTAFATAVISKHVAFDVQLATDKSRLSTAESDKQLAESQKATAVQNKQTTETARNNRQTEYNDRVSEAGVEYLVEATQALVAITKVHMKTASSGLLEKMSNLDVGAVSRLDALMQDMQGVFRASFDQIKMRLPALVYLVEQIYDAQSGHDRHAMLGHSTDQWS